jgi:Antitoxin Xre/MbcA/ParS C-terminal toxin-binding domain
VLTEEQKAEIQRFVESRFGELLRLRSEQSQKEKTTGKILHFDEQQKLVSIFEDIAVEPSDARASPLRSQPLEPLVRVIARAVEVLGSSEKALRWINAPVRSLGDQTPASLLGSPEGIQRVEDALGSIEHGVW